MAGSPYVQCVGPSYHLTDRKAAVQNAINCRPEKLDGNTWTMVPTPGETLHAALGAEVRGYHDAEGRFFCVAGNKLYELVSNAWVVRGTLASISGFVGMDHNVSQLAIVDGSTLNIFTLATNVLTQITSPGWRGSDDVKELDGFFIFVDPETDQFYISAIDDGTDLDAIDFSSADSSPDNILTHRVTHRQALFLGAFSGEFWINTGALAFPFERYQSYTLDIGVVGKHAAVDAADTVFWIGQTRRGRGIVYQLTGNQPKRVSTTAVEQALRASTVDLSGATMWSYQVAGAEFVGIDAPGLTTTWVFECATEEWHERGEWLAGWRPLQSKLFTSFAGQVFGGDGFGNVVRLDGNANSLNGRPLVRERTFPHLVQPGMEPVSYFALELGCRTGNGGNIMLSISNDGGYTFLAPLVRSLGAIGRVMERVRWIGLGTAYDRVFRIRQSDAVPFGIHRCAIDT